MQTPATTPIVQKTFQAGDDIAVENGRTEMLYRGTVLKVDGHKIHVSLPGADRRPFIFDTSDADLAVENGCIFTAW